MEQSPESVHVSLSQLLIMLGTFLIAVIFCGGALGNSDPLWFLPYFNEIPSRIIFYRDGCRSEIVWGRGGFAELTAAINQSLSQVDGYEQGFGLSPDSYKQYTEKGHTIEVFYPKRVTIHVAYRFGNPDSLFIPLSGYFGEARAVFGGVGGAYWAAALRLKTIEPIQRAAEQIQCPH